MDKFTGAGISLRYEQHVLIEQGEAWPKSAPFFICITLRTSHDSSAERYRKGSDFSSAMESTELKRFLFATGITWLLALVAFVALKLYQRNREVFHRRWGTFKSQVCCCLIRKQEGEQGPGAELGEGISTSSESSSSSSSSSSGISSLSRDNTRYSARSGDSTTSWEDFVSVVVENRLPSYVEAADEGQLQRERF